MDFCWGLGGGADKLAYHGGWLPVTSILSEPKKHAASLPHMLLAKDGSHHAHTALWWGKIDSVSWWGSSRFWKRILACTYYSEHFYKIQPFIDSVMDENTSFRVQMSMVKSWLLYLVAIASVFLRKLDLSWLVWLSGLSASLQTRVTDSIPSLGHMPGLWARFPFMGTQEATTHCCFFPSLSPSLPLSLKINK